jgi:excinuclease ABC subunit C
VSHFGSVANLRKATVEEIAQVPGIGQMTARAVQAALVEHNQSSEQTGPTP